MDWVRSITLRQPSLEDVPSLAGLETSPLGIFVGAASAHVLALDGVRTPKLPNYTNAIILASE